MNHKDTKLIHSYKKNNKLTSSIKTEKPPIYQNACFIYDHNLQGEGYTYSRKANPNRTDLEKKLAILDKAQYSFALASGTQAIHAILSLLSSNSHLLISEHLYSGSHLLIDQLVEQYQIEVSTITNNQTNDIKVIQSKLQQNTQLIFVESPSNPTQEAVDIKTLSLIANEKNILLAIDNSLRSSYLYQPLSLGADIAVQSAAKHLGGHNDLMAGVISVNNDILSEQLNKLIQTYGLGLTAFDSWLLSRSLDTVGLRMRQQQHSAQLIANWLKSNKQVNEIYYDGLGSVIAFSLNYTNLTNLWLEHASSFFNISRNFGGIHSSLSIPSLMSHQETFNSLKSNNKNLPFSPNLIRLSVGIEDSSDILSAIKNAFEQLLAQENKMHNKLDFEI
ncbi:MAG: PLP-dependent transferase [Gammaproteobacteria bacterium]|nr:MAG: PLP-dependent transferase [Gammaproteobacteria bacterium]UTW43650.1 PLP-dependent transferase [bacterium SCSIO 12844]